MLIATHLAAILVGALLCFAVLSVAAIGADPRSGV